MLEYIIKGRLLGVRLTMFAAVLILFLTGVSTIYAAEPDSIGWLKQLVYFAIGLAAFAAVNRVHYKDLGVFSFWLYGGVLFLLAVLLVERFIPMPGFWRSIVPVVNGARRWIRIGPVQVQPSEFCKIAFILSLAWYLRFRENYRTIKGLFPPFAITFLAMGLIILEPDLGTVILLLPVLFGMLFAAGAKKRHLISVILIGLFLSPVLWMNMHSYQRIRVASVILQNDLVYNYASRHEKAAEILVGGPAELIRWKKDKGYHLMHSKNAIASGGITGYGYGEGPYMDGTLKLPEAHNDFVFSLIAHQWGLLGCIFVFVLYITVAACGLEISRFNPDPFGKLISVGIVVMLMMQVIVNVSMTVGLMPITGLTLPFVSYGGSSLVVNMIALGLLNNVGRHRSFTVAAKAFEYPR
ncbi:FtsW/RodA/SpoVE family cell cycle protein [Sedimentisphaera salicampi]|nr:FtsW/RodA/SpoVE family cell cycle protein [Sedimentisphaera salicampi]